jgi:WD40 repeat protein
MIRAALLAFCFAAGLWGQYPPGTEWRRIRTSHFDIVYPAEIEADAQRAANALETLYAPLSQSLGAGLPKHTTVLLADQNVTRTSGGSVSLFPRMATFQTMPAQGFWGTNDWINTVTVQEARHLVQVAKMNHGFGKVASVLFGEAGLAGTLGMSLPNWWIAGDARAAETSLLRGGIGQYASSEMATRTLLLSGDNFSFLKAMHGSLRDGVPSQAELGAFLVNHVERTAGADSWDKIMARTAKRSFNPFSMSLAMKAETGRSAADNYRETMSVLGETWKAQAEGKVFSQPAVINLAPKNVFTGYYQPAFQKDGSLLAQKSGLDTYAVAVVNVQPDGRERTLFHYAPAVSAANRTSVVNGKMVWDEYVPDPRWIRGYSEILIRDIAGRHTRRLTHKTRFVNPVLSPDGARIAVVEFLPDRKCSLVTLDANTGGELQRLPSPDNDMIYTPAWSEDGKRLAVVTQSGQGRALTLVDLESGAFQDVIPHRDEEIANPVFYGSYILYKSSRDGVVNIFATGIATGQCYQVTAAKFGADYPSISPDGSKLLYSDYTARGYNLAELPLDPKAWTAVDAMPASALAAPKNRRDYSAEIPGTLFPTAPYRPSMHLFDVHSWGFTGGGQNLGFGILSNDKMHVADFNAALLYDTDESKFGYRTGFSYNRLFPVLDFSFAEQGRRLQYVDHTDNFTERTVAAGFHIPLNFSRGYYRTNLSLGVQAEHVGLAGGGLVPLTYGLRFSHIRQASPRDLAPAWSQILRFSYSHTIETDNYTANHLSADGRFALPGLGPRQALVLESGYERNDGSYYFSRQVQFPRGYTYYTGPNLTKLGSTYSVPLLYPDWSIGQLLYIKRIAANGFYDYGKVGPTLYRSTGAELVFDVNIFHFPGVRVGVREAYRIDYRNARLNAFLAFGW